MNHLSLFAGIGGFDLGFSAAGMSTVGLVEIDPTCRSVLRRQFPGVPLWPDVRSADSWVRKLELDVDVISAGLPCQPFSHAGRRTGVDDERWLWPATVRVIRAAAPRYVVVENVPALADSEAFGIILADLAHLGFDAQWCVLSACAFGAPHVRRRLFIVAYPRGVMGHTWPAPHSLAAIRQTLHGRRPWARGLTRLVGAAARPRVVDGSAVRLAVAAGNAVVPIVAEHIAHTILAIDRVHLGR